MRLARGSSRAVGWDDNNDGRLTPENSHSRFLYRRRTGYSRGDESGEKFGDRMWDIACGDRGCGDRDTEDDG